MMHDTNNLYPVKDLESGGKQGLYVKMGHKDYYSIIGSALLPAIYAIPDLSPTAKALLASLTTQRGKKGDALRPIELSNHYAMLLTSSNNKSVGKAIAELIDKGALEKLEKPHQHNARKVRLNVEFLNNIQKEWLDKNGNPE